LGGKGLELTAETSAEQVRIERMAAPRRLFSLATAADEPRPPASDK
jgi:hypothetical protein